MARSGYDEAINAIYRAALDPEGWPSALEDVADYVGGNGAMIVYNDIRNNRGEIVVGRLRDDLSDLYVDRYCANPLVLAVAKKGQIGRADLGSTLIDHSIVRRTDFHADILMPQAIVDQVLLPHATLSPDGGSGGFAVVLNHRQAEDGIAAAARMTQLAPHLSQALDLSFEVARRKDEMQRLGLLLDLLPSAAVLLDRLGRIVRANAAGEALLRNGDSVTAKGGTTLQAVIADSDRRLQKALAGALAFAAGISEIRFEQSFTLPRLSDAPALLVILTPLPPSDLPFLDLTDCQACLLVRLIDPAQRINDRGDILRTVYGLTAAEAKVAVMIAPGMTAPAVAAKLGVSTTTVRTHIARAFDKTNTHSQIALASLLNAIGPKP